MKRIGWAIALIALVAISVSQLIPRVTTSASSLTESQGNQPGNGHVTIEISSDPPGATVSVDGRQRGTTPLTLQLASGRAYDYRLVAPEPSFDYKLYRPFTGSFTADEDKAISVWIDRTTAEEQEQQRAAAARAREQRAQEECQRKLNAVEIIIENWRWTWSASGRYALAEGRVTNNTTRTLQFARALAEYYTSSGDFITSDTGYFELTALLPGQSTPFTVMTSRNPAMGRATIRFLDRSGGELYAQKRSDLGC